jgi:hypothetical protein
VKLGYSCDGGEVGGRKSYDFLMPLMADSVPDNLVDLN